MGSTLYLVCTTNPSNVCTDVITTGISDRYIITVKWKLAHVAPLHKHGAMNEANNYRPISLTSIQCKLMEHIVLHHRNEKLEQILHNRQHGFRQGLSCKTQLCSTYHDITRSADRRDTIHAVVLAKRLISYI